MTRDIVLNGRTVTIEPVGERRGRIVGGAPELYGRFVRNVFCPTGEGGGVDPTCKAGQSVTADIVTDPKPHPGSRSLGYATAADKEDADGNLIGRANVMYDNKLSHDEVYEAERSLVSGRSWDRDKAMKILNLLADGVRVPTTEPVSRGLAFSTEADAREYVRKAVGTGWFKTRESDTAPPESFTESPDVAARFAGRHSAQVMGPGERNAHGVILEIEPSRLGVRGYPLPYGEAEVVLPRGQAYKVKDIVREEDGKGFVTYRVKMTHDTSVLTENAKPATETATVKGHQCKIEVGEDGRATVVDGPAEMVGKRLRRKAPAGNVFCATGQGGGVDPTCSPGGVGGVDANEDWQPIPGPRGSQRLWQNRHEGRTRYSDTRPKGRTPEQQAKDAERRDILLQLQASVAQHLGGNGRGSAVVVKEWEDSWNLPEGTALKLTGAVKGSLVTATADKLGSAFLKVSHPDVTSWDRAVRIDNDGRLTVSNLQFFLRPNKSGTGFGTDVFTAQVRGAIDAGATSINTVAGRGRATDGTPMNGYYTWPRLGYDADLEDSHRRRLPPGLKGAKTVLDLYETKEGRDWWKEHGSMMSMQFDVTPGSRSLKTLNGYLASKGKPTIEFPEGKWAETVAANTYRRGRLDEARHEQGLRNSAFLRATVQAQQAGLLATPYWTGADRDAAEMVGRVHNPDNRIPRSEVLSLAWNAVVSERANRRLLDRLNNMAWSSPEAKERARLLGTLNGDVLFEADEAKARRRLLELYDRSAT